MNEPPQKKRRTESTSALDDLNSQTNNNLGTEGTKEEPSRDLDVPSFAESLECSVGVSNLSTNNNDDDDFLLQQLSHSTAAYQTSHSHSKSDQASPSKQSPSVVSRSSQHVPFPHHSLICSDSTAADSIDSEPSRLPSSWSASALGYSPGLALLDDVEPTAPPPSAASRHQFYPSGIPIFIIVGLTINLFPLTVHTVHYEIKLLISEHSQSLSLSFIEQYDCHHHVWKTLDSSFSFRSNSVA